MADELVRLPSHLVDLAAGELRNAAGEHVDLRPRSFAVLQVLAERAGNLVTKDQLFENVWDDATVTEDSLTQCIGEIRRAIGDHDRRILRTVPRRGYILTASEPKHVTDSDHQKPAIAVLPFKSLTSAKGEDLARGIAAEIFNELARNRDLRLIGLGSSFALGSQPAKAQDLGVQLGARYLVEGTAQRLENEILIDVQLVNTQDGTVAWGTRFSARATDIAQVQREIANKIAASLRIGMHETEKHDALSKGPCDLDVYQLTLRAMSEHRFTPEATRANRQVLEEVIRRDPNFALAWTQLAWVNMLDAWIQLTGDWHLSQLDEVIDQFSRAVELDPNLSRAYRGLAQAMVLKGDVAQGVTVSRRGFELGPSDPDNLLFLGIALFESGELAEATEKIEQALSLHPLRPSYYSYFYAMILWANERFEEVLTQLDSVPGNEVWRALALVGLGRVAEAREQIAKYHARPNPPQVMPPQAPDLARRFLEDLHAAGWRPSLAPHRKAV